MNDAPNRSDGPNWVESPDGEVLPPETGLNDEQEHQADVERHRAENPDYIEWTDVNPVEYDLDEAATLGALHSAAKGRQELYKPLTKSERARAKAAMTDETVEQAAKGIADARNSLNLIQDRKQGS